MYLYFINLFSEDIIVICTNLKWRSQIFFIHRYNILILNYFFIQTTYLLPKQIFKTASFELVLACLKIDILIHPRYSRWHTSELAPDKGNKGVKKRKCTLIILFNINIGDISHHNVRMYYLLHITHIILKNAGKQVPLCCTVGIGF